MVPSATARGEERETVDPDQRVAIVTGAGSGIGRASALALAGAGARVVVADRDAARSEVVATEITARGGAAVAVRCDVTSDDDMAALRSSTKSAFGSVDIVMNNVGLLAIGRPDAIPLEAWRRVLDVNVVAIARSISLFLPELIAQGRGHIVNTASTAGLYAYSYERLPYSASKGAVVALSEALALYARPRGVGVTVLCPGPVATNIAEQVEVFGDPGAMHGPGLSVLDPSVVGEQVVSAVRANRFLLLTHPEVQRVLIERAQNPERFVDEQVEAVGRWDAPD
jgi:NAD(P)-dependent dehydrogenase (short-subunit alcohol dehydrogenase family)